ncbi:MAG: four helix bundle protein, partial [Bryobacteraceae bacterium]
GFLAGRETAACACGRNTPRLTGLMALDSVVRKGVETSPSANPSDLLLWQRGMELAEQVHHFSTGFPRNDSRELRNALRRTAVQVSSRIADAQTAESESEKLSHFQAAQSSLAQFETHLQLAAELEYVTSEQYRYLLDSMIVLGAQLNGRRRIQGERISVPMRPRAMAVASNSK